MKKKYFTTIAFLLLSGYLLFAQKLAPDGGGEYLGGEKVECLSEEQRAEIEAMLAENVQSLRRQGLLVETAPDRSVAVAFDWPLRKVASLPFNSYYGTNNYVDHDPGPGLLDNHCEARTYDGHTGTDIDTWPFPWYLYDNNSVEVIAGEAGTIIGKVDGNDDDHCSCLGNWNAVFIQHADGSRAWYGHMKKNSLTSKGVGDTVAKGEYLGVVASSGCSTQPHLHFEIFDNLNNLVDPYTGPCNSLNATSWWAVQPANREPTLNALMTHDDIPVHGCPGINEAPNMSNVFVAGQLIRFATYYHDQLTGDVTTLRIRRPDNTIYNTWTHTSINTYNKSWWFWNWFLPANGPFGTWTFEVEYYGQTFTHQFQYLSTLSLPVSPVVYLQGAYDPTTGLMHDGLRANAALPLNEPYAALSYTHIGGGGETVQQSVFDVIGADAIVDWVFLELRDGSDASVVVATRSALLQRDGNVVDVDGASPVAFDGMPPGDYYLAVRHRNHLGVMSAAPITLSTAETVVDLTSSLAGIYGGANGIADLGNGNRSAELTPKPGLVQRRFQPERPGAEYGLQLPGAYAGHVWISTRRSRPERAGAEYGPAAEAGAEYRERAGDSVGHHFFAILLAVLSASNRASSGPGVGSAYRFRPDAPGLLAVPSLRMPVRCREKGVRAPAAVFMEIFAFFISIYRIF